ncbi:unnamed protein product [Prunus armeniaca]
MGLPTKQSPFMCSALLFDTDFASFPFAITSADFTNLVYKGCANQKFQDPSSSQTLKSLFDFMVSQSSQKTVYTSTSGEGQNAISSRITSLLDPSFLSLAFSISISQKLQDDEFSNIDDDDEETFSISSPSSLSDDELESDSKISYDEER